jgi:hypothetical protein
MGFFLDAHLRASRDLGQRADAVRWGNSEPESVVCLGDAARRALRGLGGFRSNKVIPNPLMRNRLPVKVSFADR